MHYQMIDGANHIVADRADDCYTCSRFKTGSCYIVASIAAGGFWIPDGGNTIRGCPMYRKSKRNVKHLKVVRRDDDQENTGVNQGERT